VREFSACNLFRHRYMVLASLIRHPQRTANHGTHPNSGGVAVTVAITLRLPNGTQQSGDTMPRGVSGIPSGSGHGTVNPWDATSLRPAKNSALGLGADTILGELCPIGSIVWLIYTIVD
jgi:hypothetical protein